MGLEDYMSFAPDTDFQPRNGQSAPATGDMRQALQALFDAVIQMEKTEHAFHCCWSYNDLRPEMHEKDCPRILAQKALSASVVSDEVVCLKRTVENQAAALRHWRKCSDQDAEIMRSLRREYHIKPE